MEGEVSVRTTRTHVGTAIREAWSRFWVAILDPWTVILIVVAGGLLVASTSVGQGQAVLILQLLASIAAAILGGRVARYLDHMVEGSILKARGTVAVRGLKLLYGATNALEERVRLFLRNEDHIRSHPEVTIRNFEEVIGACRQLQEETVSAIENWTDIVAEANIQTVIGDISALKSKVDQLTAARDTLSEAAQNAEKLGASEAQMLRVELQQRQEELNSVKNKLSQANTQLMFPSIRATGSLTDILTRQQNDKLSDSIRKFSSPLRAHLDSLVGLHKVTEPTSNPAGDLSGPASGKPSVDP